MRTLEAAAERLRVLGHPVRLKLLELLLRREATVGQLAEHLRLPHAATSQHLNHLRLHGLVTRRRRGREAWYGVTDGDARQIVHWLHRRRFDPSSVRDGEAI